MIFRRSLIIERQVLNHAVAALVCLFGKAALAQEDARSFLVEHCAVCHNSAEQAGKLDVEGLRFEPSDPDNFARWIKIHDRVKAGEMPPPDEVELAKAEADTFVDGLAKLLTDSETERYRNRGRATLRRLNRYEYENTVRDLLNIPWAQIKEKLPKDGVAYWFNKTGRALDVSHVQLARYMSTAEYAIEEAIRVVLDHQEASVRRFYARDGFSLNRSFRPRENSTLPDRHSFPVLDSRAQPEVRAGRAPVTSPDPYALSARLSMFLWNSEPDERLRDLARSGEISDPQVLRAETERLLDDSRSRRFVEAFADYWLDLREIDDNSPSTTLYNDYELDDPLKLASLEETRLFVAELLRQDLPAQNIVDSDFTFLNERLARHYGIEGVAGTPMRKVELDEDSVRGGLMTQASVLKVTANGITTSPVMRGVWVTERILGFETPPPPPVPAVEPDIRGAVTIRQQIEAHRADPSCAVCHARMDPPGLALESFDVMGAWRDRYRAVNEEVPAHPGVGLDGQVFKFHFALPVDPSGRLIDGREFDDVRQLKAMLLVDQEQIARNLLRQLTIYATGAPIGFSDRRAIETMLENTRPSQFGVRSLVHQVVQSDLFQHQ